MGQLDSRLLVGRELVGTALEADSFIIEPRKGKDLCNGYKYFYPGYEWLS